MRQLMDDNDIITITGSSISSDTITIDLNSTYGATTTYPSNLNLSNVTLTSSYNTSIVGDTITLTGLDGMWWGDNEKTHFEIAEIEKMCSEYPALAKVYENFKTVYDLVKQDWKGKKDADNNS
jgi:hypothetical protein